MRAPAAIVTTVERLANTLICDAFIFDKIVLDNNEVTNEANIPKYKMELMNSMLDHGVKNSAIVPCFKWVTSAAALKMTKPVPIMKKDISPGVWFLASERVIVV